MPRTVSVSTGSRLHFGPLSYGTQTGRHFGGVGVMLDAPGCRVAVSRAAEDEVVAPDAIRDLVRRIVARYWESPPVAGGGICREPVRVEVPEAIPRHQGFGSGTQLALAIGTALEVCTSRADFLVGPEQQQGEMNWADLEIRPTEVAVRLGRGRRSAIGIHGFAHGGFLLDAGKSRGSHPVGSNQVGTLAERVAFPEAWRFVLITPPGAKGLRGEQEAAAFGRLPAMSEAVSSRLRCLACEELLPAVRHADFTRFAEALFEFGATVGDFFAPVQGGRFSHPAAEGLVRTIQRLGSRGVAQSSWGPTLAVVAEDVADAESLAAYVRSHARYGESVICVARGRNRAAEVGIDP